MPGTVWITVSASTATVASPYEAKETIKSIPGKRWDPITKLWSIPSTAVPLLTRRLQADGYTVKVDGNTASSTSSSPSALQKEVEDLRRRNAALIRENTSLLARQGSSSVWDRLANETPDHLRPTLYRTLSKIFHPDLGGDTEIMKKINSAFSTRKSA